MSGNVKAKKMKSESVKLELMKKKERKKQRKMKSAKFEMATQAKALWEECRRSVMCCLLYNDTFCDLVYYLVFIT